MGSDPGPRDRQGRRCRERGVDLQRQLECRLQLRPGPPALCRGLEKRGCTTGWVEDLAVDGEALGRSRGGLSSKIHLTVDGRGLPMSIILTPGQAGDNPQLLPLLDQISVHRDGPGRPRKRPDRVLADSISPRLLPPLDPRSSAGERDRLHQPRADRSDRTPAREGFARRPATGVRPVALRRAQRGRTLLQQAQTVPGSGHPIRQTRRLLPIRDRHRSHRVVAAYRLLQDTLARPWRAPAWRRAT